MNVLLDGGIGFNVESLRERSFNRAVDGTKTDARYCYQCRLDAKGDHLG